MSVIINCPNGRQQSMKVTPNTSILEVFIFYLFIFYFTFTRLKDYFITKYRKLLKFVSIVINIEKLINCLV
jgi:hypothetical protein